MSVVRVYHPSADTFADVDHADAPAWEKLGWTRRPGWHIDESGALPVGDGHVHPRAPKPTPPTAATSRKAPSKPAGQSS